MDQTPEECSVRYYNKGGKTYTCLGSFYENGEDQQSLHGDNSLQNVSLDEQNKMHDLLKSWNMPSEVFSILQSKNVSIETLQCMKDRHIDQIFTADKFATKVLFEHKLTMWQNSLDQASTLSMNSSISDWISKHRECFVSSSSSSSPKRCNSDNNSVKSLSVTPSTNDWEDISVACILNCNKQGRLLMDTYHTNKILRPAERTNIVHRIVQYYIENDRRLSVSKAKSISEHIIELFPSENMSTYFIGRGKLPPKGKIWDRYQCRLRTLKKLNLNSTPPRVLQRRKFPRKLVDSFTSSSDLNNEELEKLSATLKHLRNWEEVIEKWKLTAEFRRKKLDENTDSNLHQILSDWPL